MERYFIRIEKILQRLAVSHAVPAGSWEVTVAFRFIIERPVVLISCGESFYSNFTLQSLYWKGVSSAVCLMNPLQPEGLVLSAQKPLIGPYLRHFNPINTAKHWFSRIHVLIISNQRGLLPKCAVLWLALLLRIQKAPGSNIDLETGYHA
jgi:hypothetical protein